MTTVNDLKVGDELDVAGFLFMRIELPEGMTGPADRLPFVEMTTENSQYATCRMLKRDSLVVKLKCLDKDEIFSRTLYKMAI